MSRPAILVVDDEKGVQSALQGILRDEGFDAFAVSSGEECLSLLTRRDFSVVLLDIWLPGMDGLQVLEQIRGTSTLQTPVSTRAVGSSVSKGIESLLPVILLYVKDAAMVSGTRRLGFFAEFVQGATLVS